MTDSFPLAKLPTVPLLVVARLLNKKERRGLAQCNQRFRQLIWMSEDETLDTRSKYNSLRINVEDCIEHPGEIKIGIAPNSHFAYCTLDELEGELAEFHRHHMYVDDKTLPFAVHLTFRTIHVSSDEYHRILALVSGFGLFKNVERDACYKKPSLRLGIAHHKKPEHVSSTRIADTILSNPLIETADFLRQPEVAKELARLCQERNIEVHGAPAENANFLNKILDKDGELMIILT